MKTDALRGYIIAAHNSDCAYFAEAESSANVSVFWDEASIFKRLFKQLDLSATVDLACGQGRHSAQIIERAGHVTLVDANAQNIDVCRKRFEGRTNVSFLVNSGRDLGAIAAASQTSLFSYDAMVHFEPQDVISYIYEISRVLVPDGLALLHYSNTQENWRSYMDDPEWRNFFSEQMMRAFAWRAGLTFVESEAIAWGASKDAVTLLKKAQA